MAIVRFFNFFLGFFRLEAQNLYKYFACLLVCLFAWVSGCLFVCLFVCLFESNKHKKAEPIEPKGRFMDAHNL